MTDLNKLEKLNRLRKGGALSAEEFENEKALLFAGKPASRTPLIVVAVIALLLVVLAVIAVTHQTGQEINNSVAASATDKPLESATVTSVLPTPASLPAPARVDPPVPASAAPDPTNADYYNDARRDMVRAYKNQPAGVRSMLGDWAGANELCRGSSDEVTINKWCPIRDAIDKKLTGMGMCYGRPTDESAAESDWHTCDARDGKQ